MLVEIGEGRERERHRWRISGLRVREAGEIALHAGDERAEDLLGARAIGVVEGLERIEHGIDPLEQLTLARRAEIRGCDAGQHAREHPRERPAIASLTDGAAQRRQELEPPWRRQDARVGNGIGGARDEVRGLELRADRPRQDLEAQIERARDALQQRVEIVRRGRAGVTEAHGPFVYTIRHCTSGSRIAVRLSIAPALTVTRVMSFTRITSDDGNALAL